jgi:glycerol-3-phosphate acyltransferase PlsY
VPVLAYIVVAVAAYLLGSIPTGFLVAKAKGTDIRSVGSGNIGATNAMRVLGKPAGIFVMIADAAKGFAAVTWLTRFVFNEYARWFIHENYKVFADGTFIMEHSNYTNLTLGFQNQPNEVQFQFFLIAGIFAVLGHNYTCWLKFKGGKGIATTAGVYLALAPTALGIALAVFVLAVLLTRYVSVGSIVAAIALPMAVWILPPHNLLLGIVTTALGALAIYKHKSNIQRLMAGTESRLGKKPEDAK